MDRRTFSQDVNFKKLYTSKTLILKSLNDSVLYMRACMVPDGQMHSAQLTESEIDRSIGKSDLKMQDKKGFQLLFLSSSGMAGNIISRLTSYLGVMLVTTLAPWVSCFLVIVTLVSF